MKQNIRRRSERWAGCDHGLHWYAAVRDHIHESLISLLVEPRSLLHPLAVSPIVLINLTVPRYAGCSRGMRMRQELAAIPVAW